MELPPGFRFHPTDEEIITSYLSQKVANNSFSAAAIGEVDLNKNEPWDLPSKARMGERVWYFFCQRDRKYPTGMRTNRATGAGYWKATGKDKEIHRGRGILVGMKKTLVFYTGRAPRGQKTNWVMHEFRLEGESPAAIFSPIPNPAKDEWVVCRVFHKNAGIKRILPPPTRSDMVASFAEDEDFVEYPATLPPLVDPPRTIRTMRHSAGPVSSDRSFNYEAVSGAATMGGMDSPNLHRSTAAVFDLQAHAVLIPDANSSFGGSANLGFLHQQDGEILEALSSANTTLANNQEFCPPQDTGHLIIDPETAEISPIVLPKQYGPGDLVDCPPSGDIGWDNMWKF